MLSAQIQTPHKQGLRDLWKGARAVNVWWSLAYFATKARFRRTVVGPLWMTLSLLIWVAMLSLVNSHLFSLPVREAIPNLIVAMVFWSYIASVMNEGSLALISAAGYLKNLNVSPFAHVMQCMASNMITLSFNALLIPISIVILCLREDVHPWHAFWAIPGFILLTLNLICVATLLAVVSLRYRDVPKIVLNAVQVLFFITPVFWIPAKETIPLFVLLNPVYHMLELVRAPLLFEAPNPLSWLVVGVLTILLAALSLWTYAASFRNLRKWA
jgi:lipopolysaccharide transport system permease protein